MKTILAICLLTASFAIIPTGEAATVCDPIPGYPNVCVGSYGYGTCNNGYASNGASVWHYDGTHYYAVGAGTYCGGYPGWYSYQGVGVGAGHCNYSTWQCESVGAGWYKFNTICQTYTYAYAYGFSDYRPLGCPAGGPPAIPALLP